MNRKDKYAGVKKWYVLIRRRSDVRADVSHYHHHCCCLRCGEEFLAQARDVIKGKVKSCGCLRKEEKKRSNFRDWTDQTVNYLNVIKQSGTNKDGLILWKCVCTFKGCGNVVTVPSSMLRKGKESCGCKHKYDTMKRALTGYRMFGEQK